MRIIFPDEKQIDRALKQRGFFADVPVTFPIEIIYVFHGQRRKKIGFAQYLRPFLRGGKLFENAMIQYFRKFFGRKKRVVFFR